MTTTHPQVTVQVGDQKADVDEELAPLIEALWVLGLDSWLSCQDCGPQSGTEDDRRIWIEMPMRDAEGFINIVAERPSDEIESLYNRIAWEWEPDDWETHRRNRAWHYAALPCALPEFGVIEIGISIRFPYTDLPEVLERLYLAILNL
jgi:hypothetical protein